MLGVSLWKTVYKALTTLFRESPNALIFSPVRVDAVWGRPHGGLRLCGQLVNKCRANNMRLFPTISSLQHNPFLHLFVETRDN